MLPSPTVLRAVTRFALVLLAAGCLLVSGGRAVRAGENDNLPTPNLSATPRGGTQILLQWQNPGSNSGLTSAKLYRDGVFIFDANEAVGFATTYADNITANSTHSYSMCFISGQEQKCSATVTASPVHTDPPVPGPLTPPTNVQQTPDSTGANVTLTWNLGTGAESFEYWCVDLSAGNRCGIQLGDVDGNWGIDTAATNDQQLTQTTHFTLKNLQPSDIYIVRLCAAKANSVRGGPDITACAPDMQVGTGPVILDYGACPGCGPAHPYANGCWTYTYVWRWAYPGDHVCVDPGRVTRVLADNNQADARRAPNGGAYGPNTCISGYVWRVAKTDDLVCVTPDERDRIAAENANPNPH